jgi:hypothetical protein
VAAQLFDMLARMSTSVSIAGFACRICQRALRRYRPDDESGCDGRSFTQKLDPDIGGLVDRHHLGLHLGYVGSSLVVTNPRKSGKKVVNGT